METAALCNNEPLEHVIEAENRTTTPQMLTLTHYCSGPGVLDIGTATAPPTLMLRCQVIGLGPVNDDIRLLSSPPLLPAPMPAMPCVASCGVDRLGSRRCCGVNGDDGGEEENAEGGNSGREDNEV
jgi:hypothetical protein